MKRRCFALSRATVVATAALVSSVALVGCGSSDPADPDSAAAAEGPLSSGATIDVPSDPGGGYDQTARALEEALTGEGLVDSVQVTNTPGAGGTVALSQFVNKSDPSELMVAGASLVGAVITNDAANSLTDTTPIARLIGEHEVIVVPADSEYETLEEFFTAVSEAPGENPIAIGNQGGVDHMWGATLVKAAGVDPTEASFVTFDGGGEVTAALLGGQVAAGVSGYNEFAAQIEAGELRPLAVSSDEPLDIAPDAPTVVDAGYPEAVFVNWRGIFAPPGISDEDRQSLSDTFATVSDSDAWQQILEDNGWSNEFLPTEEFADQLETEQDESQALLQELGLV